MEKSGLRTGKAVGQQFVSSFPWRSGVELMNESDQSIRKIYAARSFRRQLGLLRGEAGAHEQIRFSSIPGNLERHRHFGKSCVEPAVQL
jgi:hypothetical protein